MIVNEYDEKEFFDKSIKMLEKDYGNNFANDFKDLYIKQQKEIERLQKENVNLKSELASMWEYKARNGEAIKFLKFNASYTDCNSFVDDLRYDDCKKLLDILKGSENNE